MITKRAKEIVNQLSNADITINKSGNVVFTEHKEVKTEDINETGSEVEEVIRSLDLDKVSPIEAINILYDLKNRL